ncbi:MAG: MATE family efflux transporter, partial [Pseudomonadales bacterium]|nr:MATE family efflux transporter [Pseudomonadales bacterium]
STFVAQYFGAKQYSKIGVVVWQGAYISGFGVIVALLGYYFAEEIFHFFGHEEPIRLLEVSYFKVLMFSAPFMIINATFSGFFSGIGKTQSVMWVNVFITVVNLVLDYLFIFGYGEIPEMGIEGAGRATNIAIIAGVMVYLALLSKREYRKTYDTINSWKFDFIIFKRLLYFGFPNGFRMFVDMSSFTLFVMIIGTLGTYELFASNIAFNINVLAFLPMVGMMIAVSVLVGQRQGENRPDLAEKATWSALHIALVFFGGIAMIYLFLRTLFIWPFTINDGIENSHELEVLVTQLLKFIAFFGIFDAMLLVFTGALLGAGDTRFVMKTTIVVSWFLLVLPCYLYITYFEAELITLWWIITLHVLLFCSVFFLRFVQGKWKHMTVIDEI